MARKLLQGKIEDYKKLITRNWIIIACLFVGVILLAIISSFIGQANISFVDNLKAFFGSGRPVNVRIVWYIRMPRIVAAIVVGFGLAISGHIMQTTLQNPLASPTSLGVSNAAVFGANIAILCGAGSFAGAGGRLNINNPYVIAVSAFVFAFGVVLLVVGLAKFRHFSPTTVILLGVAATNLFAALTTLVQYLANDQVLSAMVYWSFGDLSRANYLKIYIMLGCVVPSFIVFYVLRWKYNAIGGGDELAKSLGIRINVVRVISMLLASLITAVCVSFVGIIGFVGIICPQFLKRFMGSDSRFLLPASGLMGACLLIVSDTIARVIVPGMDLPVGAITAIIGTPVFVYILLRREK